MDPLPVWTAGDLRLKPYTIALADARKVSPAVVAAARDVAAAVLPDEAATEGEAADLGFAVLHEGEQGTWLLLHWWAHGDICCGRLFRADPGTADFAPLFDRPLVACVWEVRVIDHEARAWVRTMLTERPDPEAYLADRLAAGLH